MTILLDGSTPTYTAVAASAMSVTSASFNPPSASIIQAVVVVNGADSTVQSVTSVTNTGSALTWRLKQAANVNASTVLGGSSEIWWAYNDAAQTGVTVTANFARNPGGAVSPDGILQVLVFTGAAVNQSGAASSAVSQTSLVAAPSGSVTTTATGSWVWGAVLNWTSATIGSPGPAPIYVGQSNATDVDAYWIQQQTGPTLTADTSVTIDDISPMACYNMVVWEVLPAASGGPVTPGIPASGAAYLNPYSMPAEAFITGGTVTAIKIDGQILGVTSGPVIVPIGHTITLTYSVTPSWVWVLF